VGQLPHWARTRACLQSLTIEVLRQSARRPGGAQHASRIGSPGVDVV